MHTGRTLFPQLVQHLPPYEFQKCVARYRGDHRMRSLSCLDQLLCLVFAQLTCRESLRDIVACLRAVDGRFHHMGIRGTVSRSTLADANEARDWRIGLLAGHYWCLTYGNGRTTRRPQGALNE